MSKLIEDVLRLYRERRYVAIGVLRTRQHTVLAVVPNIAWRTRTHVVGQTNTPVQAAATTVRYTAWQSRP